MGAGLFWGILIILIGISIIIRVIFNVDFPIFKILFGLLFLYIGLKILTGSFGFKGLKGEENDVAFGEKQFSEISKDDTEFNVLFGKGTFDFRNINLSEASFNVKINTVFGGSIIKIKKDLPVKIKADAVLAGAKLPNGNTTAFGTTFYQSENFQEDSNHLFLKLDIVFGGIEIETE